MTLQEQTKFMLDIARKDLALLLRSRRIYIIGAVFFLAFFALTYYGEFISFSPDPEVATDVNANEALNSVLEFTSAFFFPAILAIALGYDAIVGERANRTLHLIVSRPVNRSTIYAGKLLAIAIAIAAIYSLVMGVGYGVLLLFGATTDAAAIGRAFAAIIFIIIGSIAWASLTLLVSTLSKTTGNALIIMVITMIFILPLVSSIGLIVAFSEGSAGYDDHEYPLSVSVAVSSGNDPYNMSLTLFAEEFSSSKAWDITYALYDENGTAIPGEGGIEVGSGYTAVGPMEYYVLPGRYTWEASEDGVVFSSGTLYINESFTYRVSTIGDGAMDGAHSTYYNVIAFNAYNRLPNMTATLLFDGAIVNQTAVSQLSTVFVNLSQGYYRFIVTQNSTEYINTTLYSYGDTLNEVPFDTNPFRNLPGYARAIFMINPSNNIMDFSTLLFGEGNVPGNSFILISWDEGLIASLVLIAGYSAIGLFLFRRIELF